METSRRCTGWNGRAVRYNSAVHSSAHLSGCLEWGTAGGSRSRQGGADGQSQKQECDDAHAADLLRLSRDVPRKWNWELRARSGATRRMAIRVLSTFPKHGKRRALFALERRVRGGGHPFRKTNFACFTIPTLLSERLTEGSPSPQVRATQRNSYMEIVLVAYHTHCLPWVKRLRRF